MVLSVTCVYRTVSTTVLCVVTKAIDLMAKERMRMHGESKVDKCGKKNESEKTTRKSGREDGRLKKGAQDVGWGGLIFKCRCNISMVWLITSLVSLICNVLIRKTLNPTKSEIWIFSDELTFTINGVISSQYIWKFQLCNTCRRQYLQKVNVWCSISYDCGVIAPISLRENFIKVLKYLERIKKFFILSTWRLSCPLDCTIISMGKRAFSRTIDCQWWSNFVAPRSPDLRIMEFYFWAGISNTIFGEATKCIRDAITSITLEEIQAVYNGFRKRNEEYAAKGSELIE